MKTSAGSSGQSASPAASPPAWSPAAVRLPRPRCLSPHPHRRASSAGSFWRRGGEQRRPMHPAMHQSACAPKTKTKRPKGSRPSGAGWGCWGDSRRGDDPRERESIQRGDKPRAAGAGAAAGSRVCGARGGADCLGLARRSRPRCVSPPQWSWRWGDKQRGSPRGQSPAGAARRRWSRREACRTARAAAGHHPQRPVARRGGRSADSKCARLQR